MTGRIPQSFIDDLVSRVDIVDVINERVPLKKAGREYKACCPFHDEKTPSFTVSPSKQFYHCFGCGAHGTALGFLMDYERLEFVDAVEELAGRLGLEVPRDGSGPGTVAPSRNEALYGVLEAAQNHFLRQLRSPDAARAVDYLKGRGLSGEVARDFALGFAPPGWDRLVKALRGRYGDESLVEAGLAIRGDRDGSLYDRFRDRVMFPIRDSRGRVIAFGGRVLEAGQTPKYMNSPETPVFHKGRELYGLWEARRATRQLERLLVVEGYMDVVALAQHGITYAVATLGTAATPEHIEKLFRSTSRVVFAFDGDEAGRRAAERALDIVLPSLRDGREVSFLFLPEGDDPDTLVRRVGREAFESAAAEAKSALQFLIGRFAAEVKESPESLGRLLEQAWARALTIPGEAVRGMMRRHLRQIVSVQDEEFDRMVAGVRRTDTPQGTRRSSADDQPGAGRGTSDAAQHSHGHDGVGTVVDPGPATSSNSANPRVRHAIRLLLHFPAVAVQTTADWRALGALDRPGVPLVLAMIEALRENPKLTTGALVERFRDHAEGRHLGRLAAAGAPPGDEERMATEFGDVIAGLVEEMHADRFAHLSAKARAAGLSSDEQREFVALASRTPGGARRAGQ